MTDRTDPAAPISLLETFRKGSAAPAVLLALFSLVTAFLLSLSDQMTRQAIDDRATEDLYASLAQVIPDTLHDNDLSAGLRMLADAREGAVPVYVATQGPTVTAVAFELTGYGYSGAIRVLMGIAPTGSLLGVRVLSHSETPGLGDKVELAKSGWVHGFEGRSLGNPGPAGWKVKRDGGVFDQFSGASITPRAVVGTVHRGLELFERNRGTLLRPPPGTHDKESG